MNSKGLTNSVAVKVAIITIAVLFAFNIIAGFYFDDFASWGQFGDSFGWLTSLISGLAFCGVLFTVEQQRQEIQLLTGETKRQADNFEQQFQLVAEQLKLLQNEQELQIKRLSPEFYAQHFKHSANYDEVEDKTTFRLALKNLGHRVMVETVSCAIEFRGKYNHTAYQSLFEKNEQRHLEATLEGKSHVAYFRLDYRSSWKNEV